MYQHVDLRQAVGAVSVDLLLEIAFGEVKSCEFLVKLNNLLSRTVRWAR